MLNKIIYTIFGFSVAFVLIPHIIKDSQNKPVVSGVAITQQVVPVAPIIPSAPEMALNVQAPYLSARAALVYDLDSGTTLYSKNADEKLPIASLTKLMTALVTVNSVNLEAEATISKSDLTSIGSTVGLVAGERITAHDLLKAMLIPSGNDAALALANFVDGTTEKFVELMNQEAKNLKLTNTHFSNPVGWDSWDHEDNYSDTLDLLKIVQEVLKHDELREIVQTKQTTVYSVDDKYSHVLSTTNKLLLDDPEVIGMKTGFTSKALGNLIILDKHNGREIVVIVLGSTDREIDSQSLLDWTLASYKW